MPWKEWDVVTERMRFVLRLEAGERMTDLCRAYGISRKTGYKFWKRYQALGPAGLWDEGRRPCRSPNRTPEDIQKLILRLKKKQPSWGAKKLKAELERSHPGIKLPARSTIDLLLSGRTA